MSEQQKDFNEAAEVVNNLRQSLIREYMRITDPDETITLIYKAKIIALGQAMRELGTEPDEGAY